MAGRGAASPAVRAPVSERSDTGVLRPALLAAAALLAGLFLVLLPQDGPDGVPAIERARFVLLDAIDGSDPQAAGEEVALPHACPMDTGVEACAGLYRITFRHDGAAGAAGARWSLYVPTFGSRLIVSVNGEFLTDTRRFRSGVVVNQTGPLIAAIPAPLLRPGENRLTIRLEAWSKPGAFLDRVYIGPDDALRPAYLGRELLLVTLPRLAVAWQAALALCLLVVWVGRREEWLHLTMAGILAFGVLQGLPQFLVGPDLPDWLLRATNLAGHWQVGLLPVLTAQLVGRQPMALTRALAVPALMLAAYATMTTDPTTLRPWFHRLWMFVALPWSLVMVALSVRILAEAARHRGNAAARIILASLLAGLPVVAHDVLVFTGVLPDQRAFLTRFITPALMTAISGTLMWRYAMALNEVSRFNTKLRQEVAAAEEALRDSFAREQAQVRATALESERLRLTRDLHDGLAGQLVSMVAQCELRGADYREIAVAARRALDDLRLVVASLDDVGNDLAMMLALFHERIEPQLQAQGMELEWRMVPLPDVEGLRSEHALALFRILQEAVTNAVRHSGCRTVTIAMAPAERAGYAVRIVVADHGRGGVAARPGGHGLDNMRRRAAAMGADLVFETGAAGTRVVIDLPAALPDIGPPASGGRR